MIVRELFQLANIESIAMELANDNYWINIDESISDKKKKKQRSLYKDKVITTFNEMLLIKETISEDIIVSVYYKDLSDAENCRLDASLYKKEDLLTKKIYEIEKDNYSTQDEYEKKYLIGYALDFSPWEEILGYQVAKISIDKYGINEVVKSIFHVMTFFGLDYEKNKTNVKEELNILSERMKEVEEHPERCISIDDLFAEFNLEPETEEEKKLHQKRMKEETLINQKEKTKILAQVIIEIG